MKKQIGKKDQLIFAAISSFSQYGYESTSIDNILDMTKINDKRISRRTFYKYFDGKSAILESVLMYFKKENVVNYFDNNIDKTNTAPIEIIKRFFRLSIEFLSNEQFDQGRINFRLLIDPELQKLFNVDINEYNRVRLKFFNEIFTKLNSSNPRVHSNMLMIFFRGILFEIYSREMNKIKYDRKILLEEIINELMKFIDKLLESRN